MHTYVHLVIQAGYTNLIMFLAVMSPFSSFNLDFSYLPGRIFPLLSIGNCGCTCCVCAIIEDFTALAPSILDSAAKFCVPL